jgi:hypothetical protein
MRTENERPRSESAENEVAPAPRADAESGPARSVDTLLTAVATASGVALVGAALRDDARALVMIAGLEGSVVIVILGGIVAMFGALRARVMLALLAPILVTQLAILMSRSIPWRAPIGLELLGLGLTGFLATQMRALLKAKLQL